MNKHKDRLKRFRKLHQEIERIKNEPSERIKVEEPKTKDGDFCFYSCWKCGNNITEIERKQASYFNCPYLKIGA